MHGYRSRVMRFCCTGLTLLALSRQVAAGPIVLVGAEDDAAPWSYADGTGYVNDVVRAAFKRVGWTARLKVLPYARCKAMAVSGDLVACFSASKTSELQGMLLYPRHSIFEARNLLVSDAQSALSGCDFEQWVGHPVVGRVRGYEYIQRVETMFKSGHVGAAESDSEVSNLRKVSAGRLDAALVTVDAVKRLDVVVAQAHHAGHTFKTVCDFGAEPAYVAFSARHPQGRAALLAFEQGYDRLVDDGSIAALQKMWRGKLLDRMRVKPH